MTSTRATTTFTPAALPGYLDPANRAAIDFRCGLLAFGVQSLVCVSDPDSVALATTLDGHRSKVTLVKWAPRPPTRCTLVSDAPLLLASADQSGDVAIWDVQRGVALCWLSEVASAPASRGSAVLRLHWLPHRPGVLLCLHGPCTLAAYQLREQSQSSASTAEANTPMSFSPPSGTTPPDSSGATLLWQVQLPEAALAAAFDASAGGRLAVCCGRGGSLVQLGPLATHAPPQRISLHEKAVSGESSGGGALKVVSLEYSNTEADHLFVVLPREVILWDLGVGLALSSIRLDRTDHDFTALSQTLALPSALLFTHHDGCLSCWERVVSQRSRPGTPAAASPPPAASEPSSAATPAMTPGSADQRGMADVRVHFAFRSMVPLLKGGGSSLLSFAPSVPDGERFGGISADGRVWVWRLPLNEAAANNNAMVGGVGGSLISSSGWQLMQCGLLAAVGSPITSIAMQPADAATTTAGDGPLRHLAVGVESGHILLVDLGNSGTSQRGASARRPSVVCEYEVHESGRRDGGGARGLHWIGRRKLLSYSSLSNGPSSWTNTVKMLRLPSGRCEDACLVQKNATAPICGMRVSPSGRRLVLIHRDAPLQIWDLPSKSPLATHFVALPGGATLEWIPTTPSDAAAPSATEADAATAGGPTSPDLHCEELVFAVPDGSLFHVRVRGMRLLSSRSAAGSAGEPNSFELAEGVVTALALSGPWVVSGSAEGSLCIWHTSQSAARYTIATHRGLIRSVSLYSADAQMMGVGWKLLVLFHDGDLALWSLPSSHPWDLPQPTIASAAATNARAGGTGAVGGSGVSPRTPSAAAGSSLPSNQGPKPAACAFAPGGQALLAYEDGTIRLLNADLSRGNAPVRCLATSSASAALASKSDRLLLSTQLAHADLLLSADTDTTKPPLLPPLPPLPPASLEAIKRAPTLPTRCRIAAEILGCEQDVRFWSLAEALLSRPRPKPPPPPVAPTPDAAASRPTAISSPEANAPAPSAEAADLLPKPLPFAFGSLREPEAVRADELARLGERLAPSRSPAREVARRGALQSVSLGANAQAVSLLLGPDQSGEGGEQQPPVSPEAERDWMLGCVVAGFCGQGTQASTIAAVADRFTASGKLSLAVPLLFLIGRGGEACARLQSAGRWEYAATLAKASLPPAERGVVLSAWAEQLLARGEPHRAIEVLLSLGRVQEVAERLLEVCAFDKAALLLCALREAHETRRGALAGFAFRGAARVLLEYAAFLSRQNLNALAVRYTALATETAETAASAGGGEDALTELEAAQLVVQLARLQERREEQPV